MSPLDLCSKENQALASTHLEVKTETIFTKITDLWWDAFQPLLNLLKDPNPLDNHEYAVITEELETKELVETAPSARSNDATVSPSIRIIPKDWKEYSEKWFYSYPFGDESG